MGRPFQLLFPAFGDREFIFRTSDGTGTLAAESGLPGLAPFSRDRIFVVFRDVRSLSTTLKGSDDGKQNRHDDDADQRRGRTDVGGENQVSLNAQREDQRDAGHGREHDDGKASRMSWA